MHCLIVDDDNTSRKVIESFVEQSEDLSLAGSFGNPQKALQFLKKNPVDVILVDIEMPEMSGFDMVDSLQGNPSVIFITGKEKYAVEAFDKNAIDYLVKPVKYDRFKNALEKVQLPDAVSDTKFIFVKSGSVLVKLDIYDIDYVESIGDYIGVHVAGKRYVFHTTMKEAEMKLPIDQFCRIHRSFIINFGRIEQIEENTATVVEKVLPISRTYRKNLMKRMNTF